jgi:hypothetical protein
MMLVQERFGGESVENDQRGRLHMRRLRRWFRAFFGFAAKHPVTETLPFTTEEFARLIASGKSEDMKMLARGLSRVDPSSRIEVESS